MKRLTETFPEMLEKSVYQEMPGIDADVEKAEWELKEAKRRGLPGAIDIPEWCPVSTYTSCGALVRRGELSITDSKDRSYLNMYKLQCVLAWRRNKIIYEFDDSLARELKPGRTEKFYVPQELLKCAPYQCVYIRPLPDLEDAEVDGAFFFIDYDNDYPNDVQLNIIYCFNDGDMFGLQYVGGRQIQEAVRSEYDNGRNITIDPVYEEYLRDNPDKVHRTGLCMQGFLNHVNMFIYLCAEEPDIQRDAPKPKIKGDGVHSRAARVDVNYVGRYVGAVLRKASKNQTDNRELGYKGGTVRPHMRRAHWHLYWTGRGRSIPKVRWVHPAFINGSNQTETPVSIHGVTT